MSSAPRFLFLPVSSPKGIGEYMRSLVMADEVRRIWPAAQIHFALNRNAPYVADCPYATTLLDDTPTREVKAVNRLLSKLGPNVVIFDAAGRRCQLQHAHSLGAKVIFISQHRRKRSRGMQLRRARVIDSHWVVQPHYVIGDIGRLDRFKLGMIGKSMPVSIGPVFASPDKSAQDALLQEYDLRSDEYLIFSSGSGGHMLGNRLAADVFFEVAHRIQAETGMNCVVVFGPNYPKAIPESTGVIASAQMKHGDFINLLDAARAAVLGGGDTMLQALALLKPTLAVPVSRDQPARIKVCEDRRLVLACRGNVDDMCRAAMQLLDVEKCNGLLSRITTGESPNGLEFAMNDIRRLLACLPARGV